MRDIRLGTETVALLDRLRASGKGLSLYGMAHEQAWQEVRPVIIEKMNACGVEVNRRVNYLALGQELCRAFRTVAGATLAGDVELAVRKWANFGLDMAVIDEIVRTLLVRLAGPEAASRKLQAPSPEPERKLKRRRRTYKEALASGAVTRARRGGAERQAAAHRKGIEHSREVSQVVRKALGEAGIAGKQFIRYNAFAMKLDRLSRNYGGKTFERASADLIDLYEAKGLNREVLLRLAEQVRSLRPPGQTRER